MGLPCTLIDRAPECCPCVGPRHPVGSIREPHTTTWYACPWYACPCVGPRHPGRAPAASPRPPRGRRVRCSEHPCTILHCCRGRQWWAAAAAAGVRGDGGGGTGRGGRCRSASAPPILPAPSPAPGHAAGVTADGTGTGTPGTVPPPVHAGSCAAAQLARPTHPREPWRAGCGGCGCACPYLGAPYVGAVGELLAAVRVLAWRGWGGVATIESWGGPQAGF